MSEVLGVDNEQTCLRVLVSWNWGAQELAWRQVSKVRNQPQAD